MIDSRIEAEYASGFVLREDDADHSPYDAGRNVFHAIVNGRPCAAHGALVRVSLVTAETTYNIDWSAVPVGARPVREKHMERRSQGGEWIEEPRCVGVDFGFEWEDEAGETQREVVQLRVDLAETH